uniref:Uncharacterized protein n=1 Tax=Magallana gigas TaxID=29159 RepID=K1QLZ2_MAGGI
MNNEHKFAHHVDTGSVYVENYTYYKIGKYAEYTLTMHSYTASGNDTDVSVTCRTDEDGNFLHWKERGNAC